ncbi:hypothetical protein ACFL30_02560 [Candidatus Latescibacterota bacterium]
MTKKSLFWAMIMSVIPGLGLIYVNKTVFGVVIMITAFIGFLISLTGILAIIGFPVLILTEIINWFATLWCVIKYRGGWKWL